VRTIFIEVRDGRIVPADPRSEEMIDELRPGTTYKAEVTEDRLRSTNGNRRLYWAGLGLLVKNFSDEDEARWPTSRHYHNAMLEALGYVERLWRIDGSYRNVPNSVAQDAMDDTEFDVLFERIRSLTVKLFRYDPWDAWKALKEDEKRLRMAQQQTWRQ
jgi:muconolactone delta-isomerase